MKTPAFPKSPLPYLYLAILLALASPAPAQESTRAPDGSDGKPRSTAGAETRTGSKIAAQAAERGKEALANRDFETAFDEYQAAIESAPDNTAGESLRRSARDGFTKSAMGLAEQRIAEGRWEDAKKTVESLLQARPDYQPARELLERLDSPDYFNKTITPEFVYQVETVKRLLLEGQGLLDSGRYDDAQATFDSVLQIDRYNIAAWKGIEEVNKAKRRVADVARKATEPLMPDGGRTPSPWLLPGLLVVLVLAALALIARYRAKAIGSVAANAGPSNCHSLFSWCWLIFAVAAFVFLTAAFRYEFMPVASENGRYVLKIDRWTGAVERLAY